MTDSQSKDIDDLLSILQKTSDNIHYNKIATIFPDAGEYRRELYPKHMQFIAGSKDHGQIALIGANRTGKTLVGAFALTCHLTGIYPEWWTGRKFVSPIEAWAAGKTNAKTKDILQVALLGNEGDWGSGMIPKHLISKEPTKKQGVGSNYVERIEVEHITGGTSILEFKSYEQQRGGFEGTKRQVILLDEEPEEKDGIYTECIMRTTDRYAPGIIMCTFTPLYGLKGIALKFLPDLIANRDGSVRDSPDRFAVQVAWEDVPHMTPDERARLWAECEPHQRDARSKGIPSMGSGLIYPFTDDQIVVEPFAFGIPPFWPKAYGFDTGWEHNAAVWIAQEPDTGIIYVYNEYCVAKEQVAIVASAIKARGSWQTGAADAFAINQSDGSKMIDLYRAEGLQLVNAKKTERDSGIAHLNQLFAAGLLKIMSTCPNVIRERRMYQRDENGKIVKKNDHAMDAMRYAITTAINYLDTPPDTHIDSNEFDTYATRDKHTGY